MKKLISIILVLVFIFFQPYYIRCENIQSPRFVITRQEKWDKKPNTLCISGIFLNATKDRIYNFKNVTLTIKLSPDAQPISYEFYDIKLQDINLSAGCYEKWKFFISDSKFKKLNTKSVTINCDFDYLTEYDNSYENRIHVFFANEEITLSTPPYISPETSEVYMPIEIYSYLSAKMKNRSFLRPPKKNSKNIVVFNNQSYVSLNFLKEQLRPDGAIYVNKSTDYTNIIICK